MIRIPDLATMAGAPGAGSKLAYWGSNSDRTYQVGLTEIIGCFFPWEYGATGDGVTDDYAALQACITAAGVKGGIVILRPVVYAISQPLTLSSRGVTLQGAGRNTFSTVNFGTVIKFTGSTSSNWININGDSCNVYDVDLRSSNVPIAGTAISVVRTGIQGTRHGIERVMINGAYNGVDFQGFNHCHMFEVYAAGFVGSFGFRMCGDSTYRTDNLKLDWCTAQAASTNTTGIGFLHEGLCAALFVTDCYFSSCNYGVLMRKDGAGNQPGASRWLRTAVENCKTNGYYLQSTNLCTIMNSFVGGCGVTSIGGGSGSGIRIGSDCRGSITLDNNDVRTNGEHGIVVTSGAAVIDIINPKCAANSQNGFGSFSGISFGANCDGFTVTGGRSGGDIWFNAAGVKTQAYGIELAAGCNDFTITGMNLEGNITDAVLDSTTGAGKITNCVGYESRRSGTTGTVTPDANGNVSITHGLSKAPNWADVKILGDVGGALAVPQTTSATTITARLFTSTTGADITAGNFVLMWSGCTDRAG